MGQIKAIKKMELFKNIVGKVKYSELKARGFGFKLDKDLEPSTAKYFIGAKYLSAPNYMGYVYSAGIRKNTGNAILVPRCFDIWGQWRSTYEGLDSWRWPMLEIEFDEDPEA